MLQPISKPHFINSAKRKKDYYVGYVKEVVSRFTFGSLNEEQFGCLIFTLGLRPAKYAEGCAYDYLRYKITNLKIQINNLADEYKRYQSLIVDPNFVANSTEHKNWR